MQAWIMGIISHWGFKVFGGILIAALLGGGVYLYHRNGYNTGYRVGYSQSLKDNPPNVYNGPSTINQQPCNPPSVFGLSIGRWGFGLIHKK